MICWRALSPVPLLAAALAALAGCSTQSSSSHQQVRTVASSRTSEVKVSPTAVPTLVVTGGSVAAIVNGQAVPMATYRSVLTLLQVQSERTSGLSVQTLAQQAMNDVIVDELVSQYSARHHITVSQAAVNAKIAQDEVALHGAKAFRRQLTKLGVSFALYQYLTRVALLGQKVTQRVAPLNTKPQQVARVRHILISLKPQGKSARSDVQARSLAEQILHEIQHGASFATLARTYSDDSGSKTQGGNLGSIYPNQTVAAFNHAAFTLPLHRPVVIHTVYGYHVVEVLSRGKAPLPLSLQQQEQQQAFGQWLNSQMQRASIRRIAGVKT